MIDWLVIFKKRFPHNFLTTDFFVPKISIRLPKKSIIEAHINEKVIYLSHYDGEPCQFWA